MNEITICVSKLSTKRIGLNDKFHIGSNAMWSSTIRKDTHMQYAM